MTDRSVIELRGPQVGPTSWVGRRQRARASPPQAALAHFSRQGLTVSAPGLPRHSLPLRRVWLGSCFSAGTVTGAHDRFFRYTFGHPERAAALLRYNLPASLTTVVDWSSLRRESGTLVDWGRETRKDLLF